MFLNEQDTGEMSHETVQALHLRWLHLYIPAVHTWVIGSLSATYRNTPKFSLTVFASHIKHQQEIFYNWRRSTYRSTIWAIASNISRLSKWSFNVGFLFEKHPIAHSKTQEKISSYYENNSKSLKSNVFHWNHFVALNRSKW